MDLERFFPEFQQFFPEHIFKDYNKQTDELERKERRGFGFKDIFSKISIWKSFESTQDEDIMDKIVTTQNKLEDMRSQFESLKNETAELRLENQEQIMKLEENQEQMMKLEGLVEELSNYVRKRFP